MKPQAYYFLGAVIFAIIWEIAALILGESLILPSPFEVFGLFFSLLTEPKVMKAALDTTWKVLLSLLLVLATGLTLGIFLGLSKNIYQMFKPLIMVIQAVPVISWLSLVIFAWGIGWQAPLFIAFLALLPIAVLTTISGVHNLDIKLLEMASLYNVGSKQIFKDIYIGSLLPFVVAIINVSIGQAWKVILVTEYLCGDSGLGVLILEARYQVDIVEVYAITLFAVILGLLTERFFKSVLRRVAQKWAIT